MSNINYTENIPHIISKIRYLINEYLQDELQKIGCKGIVPSHGNLLSNLFKYGDMTMTEIANKISRDRSTVTALVAKLEKYDMVKLNENKEDLRSKKSYSHKKRHEI